MAFRMSNDLKNHLCNTGVVSIMAGTTGTNGTARLYIYSGTQPSSATSGTVGTLGGTFGTCLCIIPNIGWSAATMGTSALANGAGYTGTAVTSGTAGWARLESVNATAGTYRIDGDVGTSGANVFTINVLNIVDGEAITLNSANIYMA